MKAKNINYRDLSTLLVPNGEKEEKAFSGFFKEVQKLNAGDSPSESDFLGFIGNFLVEEFGLHMPVESPPLMGGGHGEYGFRFGEFHSGTHYEGHGLSCCGGGGFYPLPNKGWIGFKPWKIDSHVFDDGSSIVTPEIYFSIGKEGINTTLNLLLEGNHHRGSYMIGERVQTYWQVLADMVKVIVPQIEARDHHYDFQAEHNTHYSKREEIPAHVGKVVAYSSAPHVENSFGDSVYYTSGFDALRIAPITGLPQILDALVWLNDNVSERDFKFLAQKRALGDFKGYRNKMFDVLRPHLEGLLRTHQILGETDSLEDPSSYEAFLASNPRGMYTLKQKGRSPYSDLDDTTDILERQLHAKHYREFRSTIIAATQGEQIPFFYNP